MAVNRKDIAELVHHYLQLGLMSLRKTHLKEGTDILTGEGIITVCWKLEWRQIST